MRRVDRAHQPQWGQSLVDLDSSDGLDDFAYLFSSFSLIFTSSSFPVISFLTRTSSSILPFLHSFPHTPFFDTGAAPSGPPFTSFFHVDRICFFVCSLRSSEFTTWDQFPSKKKNPLLPPTSTSHAGKASGALLWKAARCHAREQ